MEPSPPKAGMVSHHNNKSAHKSRATPSDGGARLSMLLSLVHRLLSEHEVKLTLGLLEALSNSTSAISVSKLTVSPFEVQRTLLDFTASCRKHSVKQPPSGLRVIEDACIGSVQLHIGSAAAPQVAAQPPSPAQAQPKRRPLPRRSMTSDAIHRLQGLEATTARPVPTVAHRLCVKQPWENGALLAAPVGPHSVPASARNSMNSMLSSPSGEPAGAAGCLAGVLPGATTGSDDSQLGKQDGIESLRMPSEVAGGQSEEPRRCQVSDKVDMYHARASVDNAWADASEFSEPELDEVSKSNAGNPAVSGGPCTSSSSSSPRNSSDEGGNGDFIGAGLGITRSCDAEEEEEDDTCHEVMWSDELDDLSVMQMTWLAAASDSWILHPNSAKRVVWDCLTLLFILIDCITLPLKYCFSMSLPGAWHVVSTTFFTIDLGLNFNTGYFHGSVLIMRRAWICRQYLRTWFALDFIATFPWEDAMPIFGNGEGGAGISLLRAARLLRLLRVVKVSNLLDRLQESDTFSAYAVSFAMTIIKMLATFALLCHWTACIFGWLGDPNAVGHSSAESQPHPWQECVPGGPCEDGIMGAPWRHRYGLDNFDVATQYLAALHFATGLVTGGELGLQPAFWMERVFVTVMMIVGLFSCSAVLSQVLVMFERIAEDNIAVHEQVRAMRQFMNVRKVPPELQAKVRRYLENQGRMQKGAADYEVLNLLSPVLRVELTVYLNRRAVAKHPFFSSLPPEALHHVCLQAMPAVYEPGDIVVDKGQLALSMDFILRGKLRVERALGSRSVYLSAGSWFGDTCLFIDAHRTHTVSAVNHCEVLCIQRRHVQAACSEFPVMQEQYEAFKARVQKGENVSTCPICGLMGHNEKDCPRRRHSESGNELDKPETMVGFLRRRAGGSIFSSRNSTAAAAGPRSSTMLFGRASTAGRSSLSLPTGGQLTAVMDRMGSAHALQGRPSVGRLARPSVTGRPSVSGVGVLHR